MAVFTSTYSTDGDATPDAVICDSPCQKVTVRQNLNDVTGGFSVYAPFSSSTPMAMAEGESFTFDAGDDNLWQVGQVVGYTKTVNAGPFTYYKKHE